MHLIFRDVIIHNFLSYGHCELTLSDLHYCLVSGINNDPNDGAVSNGAGKSTWGSAICWALTGETIQGLSNNIKNIHATDDNCYVTVRFSVDNDAYEISRFKAPKSDLKIKLNNEDISGKGIRESEAILKERIPDLTSQLIASIIILGQGLPYKFSANSPSGRKEVLEQLSKSDFMIQDLKTRLGQRSSELTVENRQVEDSILADNATKAALETQRQLLEEELITLQQSQDIDVKICSINAKIQDLQSELSALNTQKATKQNELNIAILEHSKLSEIKLAELNEETQQFDIFKDEYQKRKSSLDSNIAVLEKKISEISAIKDICPTCNQRIPNVIKPSVDAELRSLEEHKVDLHKLTATYSENLAAHNNVLAEITNKFNSKISAANISIGELQRQLTVLEIDISEHSQIITEIASEKTKLVAFKESLLENIKTAENKLYNLNLTLKKLSEQILYNINRKEMLAKHILVINQMNMLIKRDFRGFLLINIINYINNKAKEYALDVFGTDQLDFKLNGNNIDINYCGKAFENLSGGEKQRVDLILQFALRDMMRQYLNFSSNILILDEIFDQLDLIGCSNILNMITEKLSDVESVFIISHRAGELEIPYDCQLVVTKHTSGISSARFM